MGLAPGADAVAAGVGNKDVVVIAGDGAGDAEGAGEGVADACEGGLGPGENDPGRGLTKTGWIRLFLGVGSFSDPITESPSRSVLKDNLPLAGAFGDAKELEADEVFVDDVGAVAVAEVVLRAAFGAFLPPFLPVSGADSFLSPCLPLAFCSVNESPFSFWSIPAVAATAADASKGSVRVDDMPDSSVGKSATMDGGGV